MSKPYDKPLSAAALAARPDDEIDTSDIPELDEAFWTQAKVEAPKTKPNISLRIDRDVLAFFKAESSKGYTARMAAVLAAYVQAQQSK